jgi:ketosteroid isomerase-like protein
MATDVRDSAELQAFLDDIIPRQEAADEALHKGNAELRKDLYSHNDPVTVLGAFGVVASGWDRMQQTFEWVASQFSDVTDFHLEIVAAGVSGDMAYTVAYENSMVSVKGEPPRPWRLRVTHVYRRENGRWKICHRHGDQLDTGQAPGASDH